MEKLEAISSGSGAKAPKRLVFFIHGYGADAYDLLPLAEPLSKFLPDDTRYLSLQAPFECEAGVGRQWFSMSGGTNKQIIQQGLEVVRPLVLDFIANTLAKLGNIPYALVGFSQGAILAIDAGLQADATLTPPKAIVSYSGAFIGDGEASSEPQEQPPAVMVAHGDMDDVVPSSLFPLTVESLQGLGLKVEKHLYKNLAHSISEQGITDGGNFIASHLIDSKRDSK